MNHNQNDFASFMVFDGRSAGFTGTAYRVTFANGEQHDTTSLAVARAAADYANNSKRKPALCMVTALAMETVGQL